MKTIPILMPQMGQSAAEGTVVRWRKRVGEAVAADEIVLEVESDKISFEVESPAAGRLAGCLRAEGEQAAVGETIGLIEAEAPAAGAAAPVDVPHAGAAEDPVIVRAQDHAPEVGPETLPEITRDWFSPYVLRLALQNQITLVELQAIRGTGAQGRITKHDVLNYLAVRRDRRAPPAAAAGGAVQTPAGRVVPMTTIRRTIADHMVQSIHTSAHVTMVHAVDVTHIVALRNRVKAAFERTHGVKLTYTGVVLFVTARVLKQFPTINGSVEGTNILLRDEVNIGCAVALPDESLVVPVVKHADRKSFPEIARDLDRLIAMARQKDLAREDVEDGTFTISNFGSFGSLIGTPIINQPQVAILGMGAVFKAPVVVDDAICIRDQIYLSFTFDHRVIDGAMGGRFLQAIQLVTERLTETDLNLATL